MIKFNLVEILSRQAHVSDVSVIKETKNNLSTRKDGYLTINNLKSKFILNETSIMDTLTIALSFEYTLEKKETKEKIYDAINLFNKTKVGLKATLNGFSKGRKLDVVFSLESILPDDVVDFSSTLSLIIPILSASPLLFSEDLILSNIKHKSILGK